MATSWVPIRAGTSIASIYPTIEIISGSPFRASAESTHPRHFLGYGLLSPKDRRFCIAWAAVNRARVQRWALMRGDLVTALENTMSSTAMEAKEHLFKPLRSRCGGIDHGPSVLLMVGTNLRTPASNLGVIDAYHLKSTDPLQIFISLSARLILKIRA